MAAQLIRMNGLSRRELPSWSAVAISSLPVPLSPVMRTVDGVSATLSMIRSTSCIWGDSPTSDGPAALAAGVAAGGLVGADRLGQDVGELASGRTAW